MKVARLDLNFAPGARRVSRLGIALLVAGALGTAAAAFKWETLHASRVESLARVEAQASRRLASAERPRPTQPDPRRVADERMSRQVAHSLMVPWSDLLEAVESVPSHDVALLAVEPTVSRQTLRITAEARDVRQMTACVAALQKSPRLVGVVLLSHQSQVQSPGMPVRFQVQATWGAAP